MSDDPVLLAERAHLDRSRAALAAMRAASADWTHAVAGDHVSTQHLRQQLYRRREALADDPGVPLFFGRIDYASALGAELDEVCYIGRRHVEDAVGADPLVMDWRAPMALPFYRARPGEPMGVELRRRFGFQHGAITAYEDEQLADGGSSGVSGLLEAEIERPRTGPMRDIVATIQPDQDVLVRTALADSLAIQGAPGTGKTAVGLHRAAYLLYAYRSQLSRSGVLVIGPNDSFLGYIGDVLPALGEIDARQETIESLVGGESGLVVSGQDAAELAVLKGDPRLAEVLRRAVWGHLGSPSAVLEVPAGHRLHRLSPRTVGRVVDELVARGTRYESGRELLPQALAHHVLLQMEADGDSTDDRVQNAIARSGPVREYCKSLWPRLTAPAVVHAVLGDPAALAPAAEGILTAAEQQLLLAGSRARSVRSRAWTPADLVLVDEVADLLRRQPSLGHVIVDEAQDLSAMMLRAAGRRATTGSVTLLGDLAQTTTPWGVRDWPSALAHIGHPDAVLSELVEGFRVPGAVIDFAARLLPRIAPGLTVPHSIRHSRGELELRHGDPLAEVAAVAAGLASREGTLGIITPSAWVEPVSGALAGLQHHLLGREPRDPEAFVRVEVVDAALAKGLEFDHVLLLEPARLVAQEADEETGLRRLYVCLTRAVTSLTVLHAEPLPAQLR
ncbi:MAG: AAA family ATPase [Propionicimonas sp.]|uniref:HelD family protein n=1 Tax=Propionicimonas sp. TaxID=1955623 RepID=UPI002B1F07C8|nr:AAA family ATPase [Propionicimonas sp.]MEA4943163.1 AAA family ATPase [Propionicimonas sp.]